jgi:hypothetical protein
MRYDAEPEPLSVSLEPSITQEPVNLWRSPAFDPAKQFRLQMSLTMILRYRSRLLPRLPLLLRAKCRTDQAGSSAEVLRGRGPRRRMGFLCPVVNGMRRSSWLRLGLMRQPLQTS